MRNRTYGGVRGRKTKVGRKLLRFPPTRFLKEGVNFDTPPYTYIKKWNYLATTTLTDLPV